MEKIEKEIAREEQVYHTFYCDKCGKYLLTSIEYEDGYYCEPNHTKMEIYLFGKWFYLDKGIYCVECEAKKKKN